MDRVGARALAGALGLVFAVQGCSAPGALVEATTQQQLSALRDLTWQRLYDRGLEYAQVGDLTRGEQYLHAAIERGGPLETVLPRLLRVCVQANRFRAAMQYATPYLEHHADAWALRFLVATVQVSLNEPRAALESLRLVIVSNPTHAESHYLSAVLLRDDVRDLGRADEHFRRYLELAPAGEHAEEARAGLLHRVSQGEP